MSEYEGRFLRVVKRNGWEFVERTNATGIVGIIPITDDDKLVLTKQYREPFQKEVVEAPAGLVGDIDDQESIETAARRELLEETGYYANKLEIVGTFPVSPGLSTEQLTYVIATELKKKGKGGGDDTEQIEILELPVPTATSQLIEMGKAGEVLVDAKLFSCLIFACTVLVERAKAKAKAVAKVSTIQIFCDGRNDALRGCARKFEDAGYQVQFVPASGQPAVWLRHYEVAGQSAIEAFADHLVSMKSS